MHMIHILRTTKLTKICKVKSKHGKVFITYIKTSFSTIDLSK